MFEQDYLMRMILQFFEAMARSWKQAKEDEDPFGAAKALETAITNATDMEGDVLLSLSPDSIARVLQVSGVDPNITEYLARGMLLESVYLHEAGKVDLAHVRAAQARALASAYGFSLPSDPTNFEDLRKMADETYNENELLDDFARDEITTSEEPQTLEQLLDFVETDDE